jgi:hypothetical protein
MEVSGQRHVPVALSPGENLQVPIGQEADWAPRFSVDVVAKRKIFASSGNRIPVVQRSA